MLQLTVRDILQRPLFLKAEAIASEEALSRTVRWAHIMEVTQVGHLLSGNELILTTGIGWHDDEELSLAFLRQLIDSGASGLCIELGLYTSKPSERMIELAKQEHFPILLFHEQVRYIDITQDLHAHFINQHHRMVSELEALSKQLNQLLLSGKGIQPLLKILHQTTGAQVAFFPLHAEAQFIPAMTKTKADQFYERWIYGEMFAAPSQKRKLAHRPILALDHLFADLLIQSKTELTEYQILVLDRCATAVAQEMMRTIYIEEKRRYQDDLWLSDWLAGKHSTAQISEYIRGIKPSAKLGGVAVCLFQLEATLTERKDFESLLIQRNMVARAIFEGEGFYLFPALLHGHIAFILLDQQNGLKWKERLHLAIERLFRTEQQQEPALFSGLWGVGKAMSLPDQAAESYDTAKETIAIQLDAGPLRSPFFDELHTYKIISSLKKSGMLMPLIHEYIEPLAAYDREKNGQLLLTLKVFLSRSGSKQETARDLFIARQTLYHRLDKISAMLGNDYMSPDKRLAIELAISAYEYTRGAIPNLPQTRTQS
ncbi:PucR family transcriptional regulator [Paenibacillus sp. NEAU-GSW1]|uniref:PucR family transcriptional regulator n=1 Tax=Paenibacillus sp. NEAU-GSW1 TaxID=2682486 RepID=UPI0012E2FB79|nr:PucR family transcriptional regulator [Paenibacillus sp. NEAU-GSW1]